MKVEQPPRFDLPPSRALILGSGRCGTFHISRMFPILFSEYVWSTHEFPPTYVPQVAEIYDNWGFTSHKARKFALLKWRQLMSRLHYSGAEIHRWVDCSALNVPFVYHLGKMDPEIKIIVMIRHPEGFVRSCNALLHVKPFGKKQVPGFVWDRINHKRWKGNYTLYWKECYVALKEQLSWLGREPDLVMFLDDYRDGKYTKRLFRLFDIPETQQNLERAKWFCSQRAINFSKNREAWKSTEVPDLEDCKPIWDWWEEKYAWMAEEE